MLAMDDGGRCLLDVIDDPQLLQSFLESTTGAMEANMETIVGAVGAVKQMDPKRDSRQVDHVTSSGGNHEPLLSVNKPSSGQLVIDDKQTLNLVSSSVGLIPITGLSNAVTAQPALTTLSTTNQMPLRTTGPAWTPTTFQIANPRGGAPLTVQLPQQFIVPPGMQMGGPPGLQQLVLTAPRHGGPHGPGIPPGIQPGQLVQIIQTPSGPQILPTNPTATVQSIVSTSSTTKSSSTTSSSRSNKQILPKPPGSTVSTTSSVTTNSANKCQQLTQQNTLKVINSLPPNATQFTSTTIPTSGAGPQTQQILIGPGGQPAGVIAGPQGTFLFNPMMGGIGSQPFLIQGNLANVPNSVQLTLRPNSSHSSSVMTMSNGLPSNMSAPDANTNILNALNANVSKQGPTQSPQPQTFVIPNNSTAVSSATQGMVMTSAGRPASNIIFTRPPFIGGPPQGQPTGQQFLQLQTPNGPILVAIQSQPQLLSQPQTPTSQPTHGFQLGNTMIPISAPHLSSHLAPNLNTSIQTAAAHPALHALLTHNDNTSGQTVIQTSVPSVVTSNTVIFTSQPQIITRPQLQQTQSQQFKSSAPSLNLAELLKEHGILPECSPPSSPTNNSLTDINTGAIHSELIHPTQQSQQTVLMVPSGPNQPPNIVLTQSPITPTAPPQLRLALGPDGSVILQPHITANTNGLVSQIQSQFISNSNLKFNDPSKDSSGLGSSQPSPDSTTPSIDTTSTSSTNGTVSLTTTTTTTAASTMAQNTSTSSALLEQLNTGPAVKVPDLVASLALSHSSSTGAAVSEDSKPIQSQTALIPLTVQNINNSLDQQKQTILTIPVQSGDNGVVPVVSNGSSNAVIRIGSCDTIPTSLVLTTTPTTVFASPPKTQTLTTGSIATVLSPITCTNSNSTGSVSVTGTTTTVIDQNGVPMIQVSPNNQEFLQRLETQLKSLLVLKSPTNQQKELLQELLSLQQKMNVARSKTTSDDQKVVLTTASTQQVLQSTPGHQSIQSQSDCQSQQQTPQNMHLMNLLKQTPVPVNHTSSPQIRLLTPVSAAPVNGTATIQVGNQLITFTTPVKQQLQNLKSIASNQIVTKPQLSTQTPAVILRYHTPTPTTTSTFVTTSTTTKTSIIKNDLHLDKERRNAKVLKSIQQQLNVDQNAALKPDTKRPFNSRDDACKRLLRYHVFNAPVMSTSDMDKSDQLFEKVSQHLLQKKQQLFDKFRVLLLKQSMKETNSAEHVMIDRMFINDEMNSLKTDRETVAEGKSLDLPPAPQSWYQMIRSSIEEEQKLYINRKRKSSIGSDDDYNHHNSQMRRHEEPVEESDESEDDDEDSDEDETEEKDETISNFLQSTSETNLGNVSHYYDNYHNNIHIQNGSQLESQSHVPLSGFVDTTQQHNELDIYSDINEDNGAQDWTDSILNNNSSANRRIAWNHRFGVGVPESEAAVAVESILNDDEDDEPDMSVDLSGIEGLDDNLEVDTEEEEDDEDDDEEDDEEEDDDDEEEEDVVDGYGMGGESHQHQQHVDVQMQCAIKSILDMPSVQSQSHPSHGSHNSYAFHSHNTHTTHQSLHPHMTDYRNMDYSHMAGMHDQRRQEAILRPYGQHSAGVNDPILDEAVKSILS